PLGKVSSFAMAQCPDCSAPIQAKDVRCPGCGRSLGDHTVMGIPISQSPRGDVTATTRQALADLAGGWELAAPPAGPSEAAAAAARKSAPVVDPAPVTPTPVEHIKTAQSEDPTSSVSRSSTPTTGAAAGTSLGIGEVPVRNAKSLGAAEIDALLAGQPI